MEEMCDPSDPGYLGPLPVAPRCAWGEHDWYFDGAETKGLEQWPRYQCKKCGMVSIGADPRPGESPLGPDEVVDHPAHYGGGDNPYEAIKVIEAWGLDFCLGNTVKYISRAGRKYPGVDKEIEDLKKAAWYLNRRIEFLQERMAATSR